MVKTPIIYGRPADRSLEAFKEFINAMVAKLAPDAKNTMTEEKWKTAHQKFWEKKDAAKAKK